MADMLAEQVLIVMTHGYEADEVTACVQQLRRDGRQVLLVGLTSQPLRSRQGIQLLPDRTLENLNVLDGADVLMVGGQERLPALRNDPRLPQLFHRVRLSGGRVLRQRPGTHLMEADPWEELPAAVRVKI